MENGQALGRGKGGGTGNGYRQRKQVERGAAKAERQTDRARQSEKDGSAALNDDRQMTDSSFRTVWF